MIKNLNKRCSLGVVYKTFYIRVCDKYEDGKVDKLSESGSGLKEIEIIDFENVLTSYIDINLRDVSTENIELEIS